MDGKAAILPKIGRVGLVEALRSDGSIREAAINRTAGTWFACFCVEDGQRLPPAGPGPTVGVDVGVGTMATLAKVLGDVYSSSGQCLEGAGVWLPVWAQSVASGRVSCLGGFRHHVWRGSEGFLRPPERILGWFCRSCPR